MSINDSEHPCNNFYKFACDNALKNNHGEEEYSTNNAMDYTKLNFISLLKGVIFHLYIINNPFKTYHL